MTRQTVYKSAKSPEAIVYVVTRPNTSIDLSTATSAAFKVKKSDGSTATWAAALSLQSASTVTLTHAFASDGSDLSVAGVYKFKPEIYFPGDGAVNAEAGILEVVDPLK
jgi:hypothetical protein